MEPTSRFSFIRTTRLKKAIKDEKKFLDNADYVTRVKLVNEIKTDKKDQE